MVGRPRARLRARGQKAKNDRALRSNEGAYLMRSFRSMASPLLSGLVLLASSGCPSPSAHEGAGGTTGSSSGAPSSATGSTSSGSDPGAHAELGTDWHKKGVFMEIYVRAFKDSDGD